jgi:hypothetical protein
MFSQGGKMKKSVLPLARRDDLNLQTVAGEALVYDTRSDKAYVLSPSAAAVWRACNGERSVQEIAVYLSRETPTSEEVVWYALGQLKDLLVEPVQPPASMAGISRRQFLKRAGIVAGAAAIPVVVRIVAPPPAHAQSVIVWCCLCMSGVGNTYTNCDQCVDFCQSIGSTLNDCIPGFC